MSEPIILNNRYQLQDRLGTGGMAVVYQARDLMLERSVAIKILRENFSSDPDFRERFRQEARAAANLSHPNIVTVHDVGLDRGRLFIVMELVPGDNLKDLLQRRGRFTQEECVELITQACAGIGYAHRAGLVHCDIKPHNILITPDHRVKVTDFGIARALASIQPEEKTDIVWGSPQYFAPEQAAGSAPSPASDVYSLGVIFYEMLTGRLPFIAETATELARLHREAPPTPPRQLNPSISPALERIVLKVLAKEAAARYRTADQLGRVLLTFSAGAGYQNDLPARPVPSPLTRPNSHLPENNSLTEESTIPPGYPRTTGPVAASPTYQPPEANPLDIDWITIGLALLALIAVGGLIPLYLWIYFLLTG